jgi:hypothetical protein
MKQTPVGRGPPEFESAKKTIRPDGGNPDFIIVIFRNSYHFSVDTLSL